MQTTDLWILAFAAATAATEIATGQYSGAGARSRAELGHNLASALTYFISRAAYGKALIFALGVMAARWQGALALAPVVPVALAATLLDDFANYWVHRLAHELPFLWRLHKPHHTARFMNMSVALRGNALYMFLLPSSSTVPILLFLGTPEAALFVQTLKSVIGLTQHANLRWDLWLYRRHATRWLIVALERVFVLQDFHHAHHGIGAQGASAGNFGNVFSFFDRLYGTGRQVHHAQEAFGLPAGVKTEPWWVQAWWPICRSRDQADLRILTPATVRYSSMEIESAAAVIFTADDRAIPVNRKDH